MAKIFYSLAGEGRGHASRAQAVIEGLRAAGHEIVLFASHDAYAMLTSAYAGCGDVQVRRIPGLIFHHRHGRIHVGATAAAVGRFLRGMPALVGELARQIRDERPDPAIAGFEPALPRAAARAGLPLVSLDHQHVFTVSDLSHLPASLRRDARLIRAVVGLYCSTQDRPVVCSFRFLKAYRGYEDGDRVVRVGPLLPRSILEARPDTGEHLCAYFRPAVLSRLLPELARSEREIRVYGGGQQPDVGKLRFLPIDEHGFVENLRTCRGYVGGAGNQASVRCCTWASRRWCCPRPTTTSSSSTPACCATAAEATSSPPTTSPPRRWRRSWSDATAWPAGRCGSPRATTRPRWPSRRCSAGATRRGSAGQR